MPSSRPAYGLAWYAVTVMTSFHVTPTQKGAHDSSGSEEDVGTILPHCTSVLNLLKPNDIYIYIYIYICRTAALTSRRYILNIYSTNVHTEYVKHAA